ncbi:hypothetical protein GXW83_29525 [Streptacidiphilus sp. PB12-B1b]|uniref:SCO4848 family membrane protein n=1 Tax=Streptacidiphilus sp. PB12-B1b TaxID=2705012 RepID=UPI0015FBC0AB|nr:hypothetical protein [Streptacidiphilus sp. PB12-B1b]QMU79230.1 hypothetical protein GXW83_29525 [Streptacidiphilus sp. PB12-B1b]
MKLSRRASWFLTAFGVWSVWIWVTFFKNLWADGEGLAFVHGDHSRPTAYFWIHATLALTSLVLGVMVGWVGVRALRSQRAAAARAGEAAAE